MQAGRNEWKNREDQIAGTDEKSGNHHDEFDEPQEGFTDHDGDGIGDWLHFIPGEHATDGCPVADSRMTTP